MAERPAMPCKKRRHYMKELFDEIFEKKLSDGTIRKIVEEKIEKMVSDVIEDQIRYSSSPVRVAFQEKLQPVMLQAVDNCDVSKTALVVTEMLNNALGKTPVHLMQDTLNSFLNLFSKNELIASIKFGDKIKLSQIFEKYVEHVKYHAPSSRKELDDLGFDVSDPSCDLVEIPCSMSIEQYEAQYFSRTSSTEYLVTFSTEIDVEKAVKFRMVRDYKNQLTVSMDGRFPSLAELAYIDHFIIYLFALEKYWASVDVDVYDEVAYAEVEITE